MALVDTVYQAVSIVDLIAQVNAYLATLTNPIIKRWGYAAYNQSNRIGTQYRFQLTIDNAGGAAIATPWLLDMLVAPSAAPLQTALADYRTTYAGQFISGCYFTAFGDENTTQAQLVAAFLRNTTSGASANYSIAD